MDILSGIFALLTGECRRIHSKFKQELVTMAQELDELKAAVAEQADVIKGFDGALARIETDITKLRDQAKNGVSPADLADSAEIIRANTAKLRVALDGINQADPEEEAPAPVVAPVETAPVEPEAPVTSAAPVETAPVAEPVVTEPTDAPVESPEAPAQEPTA